MNRSARIGVLLGFGLALGVGGCGQPIPPHMMPIPVEAQALLAEKGMREDAPIFIRIFKEESELEVWKEMDDGRFAHFKTYPICNWSGDVGPKLREGDRQAPEGFYRVSAGQMNPNSNFHLSFNLGYPNSFDRAHGRTGAHLMVHGDCRSAGCYAMTDALIEEIYALAREAFKGGQEAFHVHAYPFRMTEENMERHRGNRWYGFWRHLKDGYDYFETTRTPPTVKVCERRYLINASFNGSPRRVDPSGPCPPYRHMPIEAAPPAPDFQQARLTPSRPQSAPQDANAASQATPAALGPAPTFGFTPAKPSASGYAFRLNRTLGN